MNLDLLKEYCAEFVIVISKCFEDKHFTQGLILLYSFIDIVASLNRPALKNDVTREDFKQWVNDYLLPNGGLKCSADDLYAARCGLLHSYMAESKLSRENKAKQIFYA